LASSPWQKKGVPKNRDSFFYSSKLIVQSSKFVEKKLKINFDVFEKTVFLQVDRMRRDNVIF
jgi:hypothetical protein